MNEQRRKELGGKIAKIINRLISEELRERVELSNVIQECLEQDPDFFEGYGFPIDLSSIAKNIKKDLNIPDNTKKSGMLRITKEKLSSNDSTENTPPPEEKFNFDEFMKGNNL